jgi:hypothetical protein
MDGKFVHKGWLHAEVEEKRRKFYGWSKPKEEKRYERVNF